MVAIYVPPPAIRELRELCRYRLSLVRTRASVKQRLQALLLRHGIAVPPDVHLWTKGGARWLDAVRLGGRAGESLHGLRQLLADLSVLVRTVEQQVHAEATADPIVGALQAVPGIGPVLGLTVRAEIGDITRFPDAPHLASYGPGWCRGSVKVACVGRGPGPSPSAAHRGCAGP